MLSQNCLVYCTSSVNICWQLKVKNEVSQLCLMLCDLVDCSLPGSSVHGIFQQEYWSGLPFPSPEDLSNPGIWTQVSRIVGRCFYHVSHPQHAQIHVFWVHDAIKSSHPLLPSAHFAFTLSLHQGLFQWGGASHQVAKVLELQHETLWVAVICWLRDINIDGTVPIFQESKTYS